MSVRPILALVSGLLVACAAIAACVGDEPSTTNGTDSGTPTGSDGSTSNEGGGNDGATEGGGDAGTDACATADLTKDPRHCGACFHDCLSGACTSSKCQPWLVAVNATTVTGTDTDGNHVYMGVGAQVWRAKVDGTGLELVATLPANEQVRGIGRTPSGFFACGDSAGVYAMPAVPGNAPTLANAIGACVGLTGDGTKLWAASPASIWEISGATVITHPGGTFGKRSESDLAQEGAFLYWVSDANGLLRASKTAVDAGATGISAAASMGSPQGIAVTSTHAYVSAVLPTGALLRFAIGGGAPTKLLDLPDLKTLQSVALAPNGALYYGHDKSVYGFVPPVP